MFIGFDLRLFLTRLGVAFILVARNTRNGSATRRA